MQSGEGNENDGKTIIGLTLKPKKNNFARAAHFFVHFFAVVLHDFNVKLPETRLVTRSLEEMSYVSLFTFFFTTAHFHFFIVASSISHFPTATAKFSCRFFNKVWLLCFYLLFWLSVARFLVELPWPVAYFLFFSVSFSIFQICGHDN